MINEHSPIVLQSGLIIPFIETSDHCDLWRKDDTVVCVQTNNGARRVDLYTRKLSAIQVYEIFDTLIDPFGAITDSTYQKDGVHHWIMGYAKE